MASLVNNDAKSNSKSSGGKAMKFVSNVGTDRVLDLIRQGLKDGHKLDRVSEAF